MRNILLLILALIPFAYIVYAKKMNIEIEWRAFFLMSGIIGFVFVYSIFFRKQLEDKETVKKDMKMIFKKVFEEGIIKTILRFLGMPS